MRPDVGMGLDMGMVVGLGMGLRMGLEMGPRMRLGIVSQVLSNAHPLALTQSYLQPIPSPSL